MTIIRVKGFKIFRDRHGHLRCYHRKTGVSIDLKKAPIGSAQWIAECARIAVILDTHSARENPGTLGMPICDYRKSPSFQIFSIVFGWGIERGFLTDNPASRIKDLRRPKGAPEANRPWADIERHAVLHGAPDHMRSAIALMMFTGLGPKDALTLPRTFTKPGEIATRRSKTGEPVFWPMPRPLADVLSNAPSHTAITLCASSSGRPWTIDGFRASWRTLRVRLEKQGLIGSRLTLYG